MADNLYLAKSSPAEGIGGEAMDRPKVVGLTGGIACGKSVVAALLRELGAKIIDADRLARQVVEPGQPAYSDIVQEFGEGILAADGTIDRQKLGELVFQNEVQRQKLNRLTHPRIAEAAHKELVRYAARGERIVVYEAALLVENGLHKVLDRLVVVSTPEELQLARLMHRDGLDEAAARARIGAQLPLQAKLGVADDVIDNSGSWEYLRGQVVELWKKLKRW